MILFRVTFPVVRAEKKWDIKQDPFPKDGLRQVSS